MESLSIVETVANVGGTLALAVFVIVVLQRTWKEREDELEAEREASRAEREQLVEVVRANTAAWASATETMRALTEGICENRDNLARMRVILARRPCIATGALDEGRGGGEER